MLNRNCILIGVVLFIVGLLLGWLGRPDAIEKGEIIGVSSDTTIVRDTLRLPVPVPSDPVVVYVDTVPKDSTLKPSTDAHIGPDSSIVLAITDRTYKTEEYTAVVRGWRPSLVSMEVYPKTVIVNNNVDRLRSPRWVVSVGPGIGWTGSAAVPYIGVSVGWVLWSK